MEFIARIRDEYGYVIEELDLGGGLGIAYTAEDEPSSIEDFAEVTATAVKDFCEARDLPLPRLLVEPGRKLVANAGVDLYTVGILKTLPGIRKYVAVDAACPTTSARRSTMPTTSPLVANKADQPRTEIVTIAGKHRESGDAVVIDMPMQHPDLGDVVCVFATARTVTPWRATTTGSRVLRSCSCAMARLAW